MPRSNLTGGKHHKKGKKKRIISDINQQRKTEIANSNQVYAIVKKKFGGSRLQVECSDSKERSAIIPGKFFKKIWINIGDILLCDLNMGSDETLCYISHKYTTKDANILKSQGKISFDVAKEIEEEEKKGFKFVDTNVVETQKNIPDLYNIEFTDSSDDD